jgi:hypothetical protein
MCNLGKRYGNSIDGVLKLEKSGVMMTDSRFDFERAKELGEAECPCYCKVLSTGKRTKVS